MIDAEAFGGALQQICQSTMLTKLKEGPSPGSWAKVFTNSKAAMVLVERNEVERRGRHRRRARVGSRRCLESEAARGLYRWGR